MGYFQGPELPWLLYKQIPIVVSSIIAVSLEPYLCFPLVERL